MKAAKAGAAGLVSILSGTGLILWQVHLGDTLTEKEMQKSEWGRSCVPQKAIFLSVSLSLKKELQTLQGA